MVNIMSQENESNQPKSSDQLKFLNDVKLLNAEVEAVAKELKLPKRECLLLLSHRELILLNRNLMAIHEHLDDRLPIRKKRGKAK